jgi:lauroyl/myristoyl acyltransferase
VNALLVLLARALIALIQALPLDFVARLGRAGGALAFRIDARHRRVALANLELVFGREKSAAELHAIAQENFRRLGENYVCAVKTAAMSREAMASRLEWTGLREAIPADGRSVIAAIGHFGNFELYARVQEQIPDWTTATTYRALRQPALNRIFLGLRERSGMKFFERRTEAEQLRRALNGGHVVLGLLSDQHAGDRGLWLPFLGHDCSCNAGCAVFALRYDAHLCSAICYRVGLARWRIEMGPRIPTHDAVGAPRSVEELTREVNSALEAGIRRDPANWFWVHRRWKPASRWQAENFKLVPVQSGNADATG